MAVSKALEMSTTTPTRRLIAQGLIVILAFLTGISFSSHFAPDVPCTVAGVRGPASTATESPLFMEPPQTPDFLLALDASSLPGGVRIYSNREASMPTVAQTEALSLTRVASPCEDAFPRMDTASFGAVVIEIGTNIGPETAKLSLATSPISTNRVGPNNESDTESVTTPSLPPRFFITVDPLREATLSSLMLQKVHRVIEGAVTPGCGEIDFFVDKALSGVLANTMSDRLSRIRVGSFPLVSLLRALHPPSQRVQLLIVDAQGFDLQVVLSGGDLLDRVDNIVLECQHLKKGDPRMISPLAGNCENASLTLQSMGYRFGFCLWNMGPLEMNCWFFHPRFIKPDETILVPTNRTAAAVPAAERNETTMTVDANVVPESLLPLVGDLFRVMCPSFVIGHLYAVACKLSTVVWADPAKLRPPPPEPDRCPALEIMFHATPQRKRHGRQNHAMLLACATGKPFDVALQEIVRSPNFGGYGSSTTVHRKEKRRVTRVIYR